MPAKNKKKAIILTVCLLVGICIITYIGIIFLRQIKKEAPLSKTYEQCDHVHFASAPIEPSDRLNDPNEIQLLHAQTNGLKQPFATNDEFNARIGNLVRKSILVQVTENRFYQLKSLSHSQPYLIPEAIDMLNEIGYRFQKRLQEKKYNNYRFRITSLLRTEETQNNLSHRNSNATRSISCHLYGTTMDISYKNFFNTKTDSIEASYEAVQTLTSVLLEMRRECKLLAVRERHQSCFHITAVLCKPLTIKK
ncbi:MAG: DUF5715 family protein [Paludibacter sp.]